RRSGPAARRDPIAPRVEPRTLQPRVALAVGAVVVPTPGGGHRGARDGALDLSLSLQVETLLVRHPLVRLGALLARAERGADLARLLPRLASLLRHLPALAVVAFHLLAAHMPSGGSGVSAVVRRGAQRACRRGGRAASRRVACALASSPTLHPAPRRSTL